MKFLRKLDKRHLITIATLLVVIFLVIPIATHAGSLDGALIRISSWIAQQIIYVVGQLLLIAISILIKVAGFNEFVDAEIVKTGWVIVRDVANLAIVISLLIIAFYTVVNKQSFHYKSMLPKLIAAAILVNFSKSITGLLIDFGQIIMMYFVHAFEGIAAGNLTYGFGIEDMMSVRNASEAAGAEVNDWNVFGALILAVIMVVVALGVVVSMAVMLLARVITLWVLIIFSPLAFVGSLVPGLNSITSDWWDKLKKNIIFGPTLAFLFWLSMTVISSITGASRMMNLEMSSQEYLAGGSGNTSAVDYTYFASKVSSPQRVFDYMVTVGLLIMTLTVAQKAGVAGASVASKWESKLKNAGQWVAKRPQWAGKKAWKGVKAGAEATRLPAGVRALTQRMKTSKAGKLAGLDKEHTEMLRAKRDAIATEVVGGKRGEGAIRGFQYQQAMKKQKDMQEKGQLEGGDDALRKMMHGYLDKGKMDEARGVMMKMASGKDANLRTEDLNKYKEKMKVNQGSGDRNEKDYMKFMEDLKGMQKGSGDTMADYKFDVKRNLAGDLEYIKDRAGQVHEDFAKKKESDFNDKGLFKAFDEELPEFKAVLDELDKKKNMNALGSDGRENYAKIIQRMLARNIAGDKNVKLDTKEITKYEKLLEKMKAKSFVRGTGESIIQGTDLYIAASANDQKMADQGRKDYEKALKPAKLTEVSDKFKQGKAKKSRDARMHGIEGGKLTEIDKEVDTKIMAPLMLNNEIQSDLYKTANENRGSSNIGNFISSISTNLTNLDSSIKARATKLGNSNVSYIDPTTGMRKKRTNLELYENSETGKNVKELQNIVSGFSPNAFAVLSEDEKKKFRKEIENRIDIVVSDAQRAEGNIAEGRIYGTGMQRRRDIAVPQSKRVENRKVSRNSLNRTIGSIDNLRKTDVSKSGVSREVKSINKALNTALKHSKKWNADDTEINTKLEGLLSEVNKLAKASGAELDRFKHDAEELLGHVSAK